MSKKTPLDIINKKQRLYIWLTFVQGAFWFCLILLLGSVVANWPAINQELQYVSKQPQLTVNILPTPELAPPSASPPAIVEPPHLVIAKIGVDVPINWHVPVEQTIEFLNQGVAHLDGSAVLGEVGNLFISGHSSDYVWKNNPYAAVFALLPKLVVGDMVAIKENGQTFEYRATDIKIVEPNNVAIAQPTTTQVLTLMTCYPIGTTRLRYVVQATPVSNFDNNNASLPQTTVLPEIRFR